jgi:CHAT domain-containing protein
MSDTFARMSGGDIAGALQSAQIEFARDPARSHPYYWASFVIVGDGSTGAATQTSAR